MSITVDQLVLPDLSALSTIPGCGLNPNYDPKKALPRSPPHGPFDLLAAYAYPYAGDEHFKTCCAYTNLIYGIDEASDHPEGHGAHEAIDCFANALADKGVDDDDIITRLTQSFTSLFYGQANPKAIRRFLDEINLYIDSMRNEIHLRVKQEVIDYEEYVEHRRANSASRACFCLGEVAHGINLPDEVFSDQNIQKLVNAGCDMIGITNDIYSYKLEKVTGQTTNNVLTVLMESHGISLQAAVDMAGVKFTECAQLFNDTKNNLPSWGTAIDEDVTKYIHVISCGVRGVIDWSFATQRYFGTEGSTVKETHVMNMTSPEDLTMLESADTFGKLLKWYN